MFGEKDNPAWTLSNVLLMLLTARAPQAVLKQKKHESICKVNGKGGIKNTTLLNGVRLVLSALFIRSRNSPNESGCPK